MPKTIHESIVDIIKKKFGEAQKAWNQFKASGNTAKQTIPSATKTVKNAFDKDSIIQKRLKEIYQK